MERKKMFGTILVYKSSNIYDANISLFFRSIIDLSFIWLYETSHQLHNSIILYTADLKTR